MKQARTPLRNYILPLSLAIFFACSFLSYRAARVPPGQDPTPVPTLQALKILGRSRSAVEAILGQPQDEPAAEGRAFQAAYAGGHTVVYRRGPYRIHVHYDGRRVARGLMLDQGIEEQGLALSDWPELIDRLGLRVEGVPTALPDAYIFENEDHYIIEVAAARPDGPIATVQVYTDLQP